MGLIYCENCKSYHDDAPDFHEKEAQWIAASKTIEVWVLVVYEHTGPEENQNSNGKIHGDVKGVYRSEKLAQEAGEYLDSTKQLESYETWNIGKFFFVTGV
jgi:hypothetical protein